MKTYLYNNNFTEQSVRQMETMLSFLDNSVLVLDKSWIKHFNNHPLVEFMSFTDFLNINTQKNILFFNIIDGYKLRKYKSSKTTLIFRPRGLVPEESYYKNQRKIKKIMLNYIESSVMRNTNHFIFLNEAQKGHFMEKYSKYEEKIKRADILPNLKLSMKKLIDTRKDNSKVRLVYSGGFSKWQNINLIFEIVRDIDINSNSAYEFTILTFEKNFEKAKVLANKYGISDNIILKYVEPDELDEELSNHDVGIIIRDNNLINLTASPFKIIDYISNGLALILTTNLADGINEILNEDQYFTVGYKEAKLSYSSSELNRFISSSIRGGTKNEIINNYQLFLSEVPKIDLSNI